MKKRLETQEENNLLPIFEAIHDFIYANDGLSPQQILEELVIILFLKIVNEQNIESVFYMTSKEWENVQRTGKATSLTKRVKNLFNQVKKTFTNLFNKTDKIKLSPLSLAYIITQLQDQHLTYNTQDAKGLAFQKLLSHKEKDGRGQFFTPEPVIDFCVRFLNPLPKETVIDPACGSGGFLLSTYRYWQNHHPNQVNPSNLYGIEINKSIARLAKMQLWLETKHAIPICCENALGNQQQLQFKLNQEEGFDVVLANPPFGAKISNQQLLSKYDLGFKWTKQANTHHKTTHIHKKQYAEILFIERCLNLLKKGGRMGIVLPNGNFDNPSLEYLRNYIKTKATILGVVNLPKETFIPYGTAVKTSLLFLKKEKSNTYRKYSIFFGRICKLGYQGNKNGSLVYKTDNRGKTLSDQNGNSILDEDFSVLLNDYKHFLNHTNIHQKNAFSLSNQALNGRLDFDFYAPSNRNLLTQLASKQSVRLGDICNIIKTKSPILKDKEALVNYVELSDVNPYANEIISYSQLKVHQLPNRASYELQTGDIITAIAGNSVGTVKHATAWVTEIYSRAICTNGFRILRNSTIDPYYLLYFFRTSYFLKQLYMYRTGAAIPFVSDNDLASVWIYVPSKKEIERISQQIKMAMELRQQSRRLIDNIEFGLNI